MLRPDDVPQRAPAPRKRRYPHVPAPSPAPLSATMELAEIGLVPVDSSASMEQQRCPASRRIKSSEYAAVQPRVVSFAPGCGAHGPKPNRRREEARALENLQRRVEASQLSKGEPAGPSTPPPTPNTQNQTLDNRPQLLHKILSNRPLTIEGNREAVTHWQDSEFIMECVAWHNIYRQRHNSPPLALCPQLCGYAQAWANHLAHINTFYYRTERDVGQNIYCRPIATSQSNQQDITGQEVTQYWYSAGRQYNYLKEPDVLHANVNAGHFTQLLWASSRHIGVGKARSRSGKVLIVAHYRPPGNFSGLFQQNVSPPEDSVEGTSEESGSESSKSAEYVT